MAKNQSMKPCQSETTTESYDSSSAVFGFLNAMSEDQLEQKVSDMNATNSSNFSMKTEDADIGDIVQIPGDISKTNTRKVYQKILFEQKELLVKLYEEGRTIAEAASMTNIKVNTAKCILRSYKEHNDVLIDKRHGGVRSRKLTNEVLSVIEACIEKNPAAQLEHIRKILAERKIFLSKSSINNGLRELKITLKLPSYDADQVNLPQAIEHRRIFALEFANWALDDRHKMVFIDECGYNLHLRRRQFDAKDKTSQTVLGRSAIVIAALNSNGIIHSNIFGSSSCSTTKFAKFLGELVDKLSSEDNMQDAVLIMDNAGIHISREVAEIFATSKLSHRTLPVFSPMLNPLEKSFNKMKAYARTVLIDSSIEERNLVEVMQKSVSTITAADCSNYIMDVILLLHDAMAGRPFQYGDVD